MTRILPENAFNRLKSHGFLVVPLAPEACRAVAKTFEAAYPFFRGSADEKLSNKLPGDFGYRPIGIEYSQSPERPDLAESFSVSVRTRTALSELRSASAQILYQQMLATVDFLEPIAEAITMDLAETLCAHARAEKLRGAFRNWSRMQLNYSRPTNVTVPYINEPHEDGDLMTLTCATGPGLELQTATGEFVPITISPNELLIIPGEILWLLSGGKVLPLWHCVRPDSRYQERLALLFFGDIDPELCEPWITNGSNANVDIGARVQTSVTRFGLTEFAS